jgi:hypothetical protein
MKPPGGAILGSVLSDFRGHREGSSKWDHNESGGLPVCVEAWP